jgi:hypothetical protein
MSSPSVLPAAARLARHFEIDPATDGCWTWTGALSSQGGYPGFWLDDDFVYAHRLMYEQTYGSIPDGWHVHHACGCRTCIRPDHLEAISPDEHRARHAAQCAEQRIAKGSYWTRLRDNGLAVSGISALVGYSTRTIEKYMREARLAQATPEAA